jgi:surface antigen
VVKPKPKPIVKKTKPTTKKSATSIPQTNYSSKWKSIIAKWYYNPNISNGFYRWHCTRYVAIKKFPYINSTKQSKLWWWNANKRYDNAKNAGYAVWQTPKVWSIVVIKYWWANYYYAWHVAIILKIEKNRLLIEEMNAVWKFIVTRRWISIDSKIKWYIYY